MEGKQRSKYLVATDCDALWGLTVNTVGYEEIPPGASYPTKGHAEGYYFDVEQGRDLNEYQLLYVVQGAGMFRSTHIEETELREGDLFILFPGEHHSYYPKDDTGWKCYWIGFKGKNMDDRLKAGYLTPEKVIYHIGYSSDMVAMYEAAYKAAVKEQGMLQPLLAGLVNLQLGLMYTLERNIQLSKNQTHVKLMNLAKRRIREEVESSLTIHDIAEELDMSYSNFRKLFKEHVGISPANYQQDLKLQRAMELLTTTNLSIKEIAYRLNFDSPDYFSSKFRAKTGRKPTEMRK